MRARPISWQKPGFEEHVPHRVFRQSARWKRRRWRERRPPPKAAAAAVQKAGQRLRDLRIAEIAQLDMQIKSGRVDAYRAKVKVSFKYEGDS